MIVSGLAADGDWRFGKGRANYLRRSDAIRQSVVTRLRSFVDDWFLDTEAGLPWLDLLGTRNNEAQILREIEQVVLATEGVRTIERLELVEVDTGRNATIRLAVRDIFNQTFTETVGVLP